MSLIILVRAPPYHIQMASKAIIYRTHLAAILSISCSSCCFLSSFSSFSSFSLLELHNKLQICAVSLRKIEPTHLKAFPLESHLYQWQWASSLLLLSLVVLWQICVTMVVGTAVMWDVWTFGVIWERHHVTRVPRTQKRKLPKYSMLQQIEDVHKGGACACALPIAINAPPSWKQWQLSALK
jgi:hypothetical protein